MKERPNIKDVGAARAARAVRSTYIAFMGTGFAFSSWASRVPQVRDHFHLTPSTLGVVLLAISAGSVLSLPVSGTIIAQFGSRRTVAGMAVLFGAGLGMVASGLLIGLAVVATGLFLLGFANGAWDVAMNVHGAALERVIGHSILPRFHAAWSLSTVAGALVGAAMVALSVPVPVHLGAVAALVVLVIPMSSQGFLAGPERPAADRANGDVYSASVDVRAWRAALVAWREPRTLAIGIFVVAFSFAEGAGNDWINVAVIDGYHVPAEVGSLTLVTFLAAMTVGRWFGPMLLDRYGRVPVVRFLAVTGAIGAALFVVGPATPLAFVGALLWGAGVSLGLPVGLSAAADDPSRAAARVSVVSSVGYAGFLSGPPLLGFLGNQFTVRRALAAVAVLLDLDTMITKVIRPLPDARP